MVSKRHSEANSCEGQLFIFRHTYHTGHLKGGGSISKRISFSILVGKEHFTFHNLTLPRQNGCLLSYDAIETRQLLTPAIDNENFSFVLMGT